MRRRTLLLTAFALVALALAAGAASAAAEPCAVAIALSPGEGVARVTHQANATVGFDGAFSVLGHDDAERTVSISANLSEPWVVRLSRSTQHFDSGTPANGTFSFNVTVPIGTPATSIAQVFVTAVATANGTQCAPAQAYVVVTPQVYWGETRVSTDHQFLEIRGDQGTFQATFTLTRATNLPLDRSVRLRVIAPAPIRHDAPETVTLVSDGKGLAVATVVVHFTFPELRPGTYSIRVSSDPAGTLNQTQQGGLVAVPMVMMFVRVPSTAPDPLVIGAFAWAGIASVAVAWLMYQRGKPRLPK